MKFNRNQVKKHLQSFDFTTLFIEELGWDYADISPIYLSVNGENYTIKAISQKRGLMVYHCVPENGILPNSQIRKKIDIEVTSYSQEHLIIYTDKGQEKQIWQWVRREPGKPVTSRENHYYIHQSGEGLIQKLETIYISIKEEENLTLLEVTKKTKKAFDVDKVTKKFYDQFKKEYKTFLDFIKGIPVKFDQEWYASLMLNRLMFIYFIQRKGFLNNDLDYLRTKLNQCQQINNQQNNTFYSFYRYFLLRLFHDGLGSQNRSPELETLLGKVPYLNGGLFTVHYLEQTYSQITIPDTAFTQIFNFFDQYNWYLDERPLKNDHEINPDVLGYIFEKYINQKQMGAYYTKEDITEYISKNCIIPYLFDAVKSENYDFWNLLKDYPERYIYEAVKKGVNLPLPEYIAIGLHDVSQRQSWNQPAEENYGLPTEIWREYITRKHRYIEVREKLVNGEVKSINDLITYNLNIRQFAEDVINNCQDPQFLYNIYDQLGKMSILDPTCGSGAFLFAALNILEPLYDACLEKMTSFLEDNDNNNKNKTIKQFRQILNDVKFHHNRRYFILKKIMLNNLFGVDIMEEATEICKLRLFLKLAAQVTPNHSLPNYGIEPLPDIDFNIRAGNSLVGFANYDQVKKAVEGSQQLKLDLFSDMTRIDEKAKRVSEVYQTFRDIQTSTVNGSDFSATKELLQESLDSLNEELNEYLAREYGIDVQKKQEWEKWKLSHCPFHWFVEFYGIISRGGFDVIIGNPPYVEYSKVKKDYEIKGYQTEKCNDLYSFLIERSIYISHQKSWLGMIIPISFVSTNGFDLLRNLVQINYVKTWISTYAMRPSKLFENVDKHLCICIGKKSISNNLVYSSKYYRWYHEERNYLFQLLKYVIIPEHLFYLTSIPKFGTILEISVFEKVIKEQKTLGEQTSENGKYSLYHTRKLRYFLQFLNQPPTIINSLGKTQTTSELKTINFDLEINCNAVLSVYLSSLFFWYFLSLSDCRNVNKREVNGFLFNLNKVSNSIKLSLSELAQQLMLDLQKNSIMKDINYVKQGILKVQFFSPKLSKPIIDEIDKILAEHYGFTEEELDFIINYDIKYRMGKELEEDDN
ncbi:MAG: Eco57I restriction-modification methylase domain-containing protein [Dolichospermum sp.]